MTLVRDQDEVFDTEMQCSVLKMDYNFETRAGQLFMVDGDCCDMGACIAFFTRIDPLARSIQTFSGEEKDTAYERKRDGVWVALD